MGWFFIIIKVLSLESFGVPYFLVSLNELKDMFIRAPLRSINKSPVALNAKDNIKQSRKV